MRSLLCSRYLRKVSTARKKEYLERYFLLQALQKERETLEALRPELTEGTNIYIFF
jgi:hypothetical protein